MEHGEERAEEPGRSPQLPAVCVVQEPADRPAEGGEDVADGHLGVLVLARDVFRERSSRCDVPLGDGCGQDEHAHRRVDYERPVVLLIQAILGAGTVAPRTAR